MTNTLELVIKILYEQKVVVCRLGKNFYPTKRFEFQQKKNAFSVLFFIQILIILKWYSQGNSTEL